MSIRGQVEFHRQYYEALQDRNGSTPEGIGYTRRWYLKTIAAACEFADFRGKSVLDVGCGYGDALPYVKGKHASVYHGIDLVGGMVQEAERRYGGVDGVSFQKADVFDFARTAEQYDIVLAIGIVSAGDKEWFDQMLRTCWGLARESLVLTCTTAYVKGDGKVRETDRPIFKLSPDALVREGLKYTQRLFLRHDYSPTTQVLQLVREDR